MKLLTHEINMPGFSITLQRKRIKNINLRIRRTGEVQVSAPLELSLDSVQLFINQKYDWIEKHRNRLLQIAQQENLHNLLDGKKIYFLGEPYSACFHEETKDQRIERHGDQMHFYVKSTATEAHKASLLTQWYRAQMEEICPQLLQKWQSIFDIDPVEVRYKRMKSRWGSCHPIKKQITLNIRLIEKPLICLEYVIVHEFVHFFERGHNHRFYALMSHYLPEWKDIKKHMG